MTIVATLATPIGALTVDDASSTTCGPARCSCRAAAALAVRAPAVVPAQVPVLRLQFARGGAPATLPEAALPRRARAPTSKRRCRSSGAARVHSVFIGGGTPSLFSPAAIDRLLARRSARACRSSPAARSRWRPIPGTFERERFRALRAAGVRGCRSACRASTTRKLRALGRVHDRAQARAAVERRRAAFDTFNLDLMYALPGQTLAEMRRRHRAGARVRAAAPVGLPPDDRAEHAVRASIRRALPDDDLACAMLDRIAAATAAAGLRALRGLGVRARRATAPPQPQLLGVRRLPRHRRRRARQAQLPAPRRAPGAPARPGRLHGAAPSAATRGRAESEIARARAAVRVHAQRAAPEGRLRARALRRAHRPAAVGDRAAARRGRAARPGRARPARVRPTPRGFDFLSDLQPLFLPARA